MYENQKVYKIIDTSTGMFAQGGRSICFYRKGKCWTSLGDLKKHLNLFFMGISYRDDNNEVAFKDVFQHPVNNVMVLEFSYEGIKEIPISEFIKYRNNV